MAYMIDHAKLEVMVEIQDMRGLRTHDDSVAGSMSRLWTLKPAANALLRALIAYVV